jgi:hypothetical protein
MPRRPLTGSAGRGFVSILSTRHPDGLDDLRQQARFLHRGLCSDDPERRTQAAQFFSNLRRFSGDPRP